MTANEKLTSTLTNKEIAKKTLIKHRSFNLPEAAEQHPAPEIEGIHPGGLLPKSILDKTEIPVLIRKLSNDHEYKKGDKLKLQVIDPRKGDSGPVYEGGAEDLPDSLEGFPLTVFFPSSHLVDDDKVNPETSYQVRFIVTDSGTGNDLPSLKLPVLADRYAPYQSKHDASFLRPDVPEVLNASSGIDEQWLIDNKFLQLKFALGYQFRLLDDVFKVSISTTQSGADGPLLNVVYSGALGVDGLLDVSVEKFASEVANDGDIYVYCTVTDATGNVSKVSYNAAIRVALRPEPEFNKPRIPIVGEGGVLNYETFKSTIYAYVDRGKNWFHTDKILLQIQSTIAGATPIDVAQIEVGIGTGPLRFPLRYQDIKLLFIDRETPTPTKSLYLLKRGTETPRPSPATQFTTDLTEAGPINPNLPSETNPNMVKVGVTGDSGTLNHITGLDRGKPVTIQTPMKNLDDTWVILGNEIARLWYHGVKVFELALTGSEAELTHDIPVAIIEQVGTGRKDAWWDIIGNDSSNTWVSPKTVVTVDPKTVEFVEPWVQDFPVGGIDVINCKSLELPDRHLKVVVPVVAAYMPKDSVVIVCSVGASDKFGFDVIGGTEFSESHTISDSDLAAGEFSVNIKPYLTKIRPMQPTNDSGMPNGSIKLWYVVQVDSLPVSSKERLREVRLLSSGVYCEDAPTR
ncbi:hypothetical protein [Pseudomonas helvetica]|uniref:hypothetical protein n=1 Tax=Pseudomonas helvetica TaxID=3136738 RepID=UPI00326481CF